MSSGVSKQTAARVHRLLRSLVGVTEVRLDWSPAALREVHLLKDPCVQQHQLIRNVVSGLKAAFGIGLEPAHVHIYDDAAAFAAVVVAPAPEEREVVPQLVVAEMPAPALLPPSPEAARPVELPAASAGDIRRRPGRSEQERALGREPIMVRPVEAELRLPAEVVVLDHIDVERHGATLRCRIVIRVAERTYSAVADAVDAPTAEPELAARVTLDALRAGGLSAATLQGIGLITIADCSYVVATVRDGTNGIPRAGSVPLLDSMAWSAALAVLRAAGADAPVEMRPAKAPAARHLQLHKEM